ncbi:hypothetical protein PSN_1745 [Pseudomonas sp. NGC7]
MITHSRPSFPLPVPWSRTNTAKSPGRGFPRLSHDSTMEAL